MAEEEPLARGGFAEPERHPLLVCFLGEGDFTFTFQFCRSLLYHIKHHLQRDHRTRAFQKFSLESLSEYLGVDEDVLLNNNPKILATSLDTGPEVLIRYPNARTPLEYLGSSGSASASKHLPKLVKHNVDATTVDFESLAAAFGPHELHWDRICWNHPHSGLDDVESQSALLDKFFRNAKRNLAKPNGQLVITLIEGQFERWNVQPILEKQSMKVSQLN